MRRRNQAEHHRRAKSVDDPSGHEWRDDRTGCVQKDQRCAERNHPIALHKVRGVRRADRIDRIGGQAEQEGHDIDKRDAHDLQIHDWQHHRKTERTCHDAVDEQDRTARQPVGQDACRNL